MTPDILEVKDSSVIGTRTPAQGGIINIVKHKVLAFDGNLYTCYSQSEYRAGQVFRTEYYGFELMTDDSSMDDTERIFPVNAEAQS